MSKYYIHKYIVGGAKNRREACSVYSESDKKQAFDNMQLLGGAIIVAQDVESVSSDRDDAISHQEYLREVIMCEISEALDGTAYAGIRSEPGSVEWDLAKVALMNNLANIFDGKIDPACGKWSGSED
ncbi:hypothetical protein [Erwinia phage Snitter]|nr:hypothetical protein [Erwinia phage Snitter]